MTQKLAPANGRRDSAARSIWILRWQDRKIRRLPISLYSRGCWAPSGFRLSDKLCQEHGRGFANRPEDEDQPHHVQAVPPKFHAVNVVRLVPESPGQLVLADPGCLTGLPQESDQDVVFAGFVEFRQSWCNIVERPLLVG